MNVGWAGMDGAKLQGLIVETTPRRAKEKRDQIDVSNRQAGATLMTVALYAS